MGWLSFWVVGVWYVLIKPRFVPKSVVRPEGFEPTTLGSEVRWNPVLLGLSDTDWVVLARIAP